MEENTTPTAQKSSMGKMIVPVVVIGIIVIAVIAFYVMGQNKNAASTSQTPENAMQAQATTAPTTSMEAPTGTEAATSAATYKDGTYDVDGNYVSPGGPRDVEVSLTLKDNVITAATFKGLATDATSKRFQTEFAEGYKSMVVGKNIDDVSLTKVSGSSLTPKGFMDAIEKVKTEAQS